MLIKIDVEKAYDTLCWNVLLDTLLKLDFSIIWISLVKTYLSLGRFSFPING